MYDVCSKETKDFAKYFSDYGFDELVRLSELPVLSVNQMIDESPYKPDLHDLYSLHCLVRSTKRTTILEFGVGWSSLVLAHALFLNKMDYAKDVKELRRNNPFELHCVDDEQRFLDIAKERISNEFSDVAFFHYSRVNMVLWNGRVATEYDHLPLVNPDFIYLDGPDQFNVQGDVNGVTTNHKDMMPMVCDILKIEHFLTPGTIILVDGRTANARFLKANFQRNWEYRHLKEDDQHIFELNEEPLGKYNKKQIEFYGLS